MYFNYQNNNYEIKIIKKNNKNTYIRVKDNLIEVTTNYFTPTKSIEKLINNNRKSIERMINQSIKRKANNKDFKIFGKIYNIIYDNISKTIKIDNNNIYIKDEKTLDKWLNKYIYEIFYNHLIQYYNKFEENIPKPSLKLRKMKTRWGVCNTKTKVITLNKELIKYNIECLDYVIVHELSHLIEGNHSRVFWNIVSKYYPNYKECRKKLRE